MLLYYFTGDLVLLNKFCADSPQTSLSSHSKRELPSQNLLHIDFKTEFLMLLVKPTPPTILPTSNGIQFNHLLQAKNLSVIVDYPFSHSNEDIPLSLPSTRIQTHLITSSNSIPQSHHHLGEQKKGLTEVTY